MDIITTRPRASDTGYSATYVDNAYFRVLLCVDEVLCGISQRLCIVVRQSLLVTVEVQAKLESVGFSFVPRTQVTSAYSPGELPEIFYFHHNTTTQ